MPQQTIYGFLASLLEFENRLASTPHIRRLVTPGGRNYGERNRLRISRVRNAVWFFAALLSLAVFCGAFIGASPPEAQEATAPQQTSGISVQASPQIFATMCALDAAGLDADEGTLSEMPARLALRDDLLKMQGTATDALRQFYKDHALESPTETLSRYITFALIAGPPPAFEMPGNPDQLPPDVLTIDGFQKVLADFYQEAHLDIRWAKIEPEYEPSVDRYRTSLRRIVTVSDAYLREISKTDGRSFTVYVEPLVGARTNFRNFGDRYAIVVGGNVDARANAIQHAYLHFMLDRLVLRHRNLLDKKNSFLNVAAAAPRLPMEYRDDFVAFTDECLIKAVELRLRRLTGGPLEAALQDADQSGYVLVRPLVAGLQKFEKAEPAMSYYFPDLIAGIDFDAERKRAQGIKFCGRSNRTPKPTKFMGRGAAMLPNSNACWPRAIAKLPTRMLQPQRQLLKRRLQNIRMIRAWNTAWRLRR